MKRTMSAEQREEIRKTVKTLTPGIFAMATALYRAVQAMNKGVEPTYSAQQFIDAATDMIVEAAESGAFD